MSEENAVMRASTSGRLLSMTDTAHQQRGEITQGVDHGPMLRFVLRVRQPAICLLISSDDDRQRARRAPGMMWRPPRPFDIVATISVLSVTEKTACRAFAGCVCVEKLTGDRGVENCLSGALALSQPLSIQPLLCNNVQPCSLF